MRKLSTDTGAATTIGAIGMGTYAGLGTYNNALYGLLMLSNGGTLQKIDPGTGKPISSVTIAANFAEGGVDRLARKCLQH